MICPCITNVQRINNVQRITKSANGLLFVLVWHLESFNYHCHAADRRVGHKG